MRLGKVGREGGSDDGENTLVEQHTGLVWNVSIMVIDRLRLHEKEIMRQAVPSATVSRHGLGVATSNNTNTIVHAVEGNSNNSGLAIGVRASLASLN